jgi:hypothetical protein
MLRIERLNSGLIREFLPHVGQTRDSYIKQQLLDIAQKWRTMADHLQKYSR